MFGLKFKQAVKRLSFTMLRVLTFCAAMIAGGFAFQSCNNDNNVPAPASTNFDQNTNSASGLESIEEVADDTDPGARQMADVIDKANKVYQVFKVTGTYGTTATSTGASLAVTTQSISSATLPDSTVKGKNGYSMFSVKTEKFNTFLKKTVDKTKSQTYWMKDKDAKVWHKLTTVNSGGATFTFLPNYYKDGLTFSTSGGTSGSLD